jgi:hypothetical protein
MGMRRAYKDVDHQRKRAVATEKNGSKPDIMPKEFVTVLESKLLFRLTGVCV